LPNINYDEDDIMKKLVRDNADLQYREEFVFENGAVYKGQWKGDNRHGYGEQIWPDGAKYEGYWKDNKAHG
jgi:hypothetical protein